MATNVRVRDLGEGEPPEARWQAWAMTETRQALFVGKGPTAELAIIACRDEARDWLRNSAERFKIAKALESMDIEVKT